MEGPCFCLNPPQTQGLMFILVRVYVHEKKTLLAVGATKLWMAGAPLLFSEAGRGCGVRYFCWAGGWLAVRCLGAELGAAGTPGQ